jgi:hypothetical protein
MATSDERIASLEARVETMDDLRKVITDMRSDLQRDLALVCTDVREFRGDMRASLDDVRADARQFRNEMRAALAEIRAEARESRNEMQAALAGIRSDAREFRTDVARQFADVNRRFEGLDQKVDRDFRWIVGIQMTVMSAVMTVLFTAVLGQP